MLKGGTDRIYHRRIVHNKYNSLLDMTNGNRIEINADDIIFGDNANETLKKIHYCVEKVLFLFIVVCAKLSR